MTNKSDAASSTQPRFCITCGVCEDATSPNALCVGPNWSSSSHDFRAASPTQLTMDDARLFMAGWKSMNAAKYHTICGSGSTSACLQFAADFAAHAAASPTEERSAQRCKTCGKIEHDHYCFFGGPQTTTYFPVTRREERPAAAPQELCPSCGSQIREMRLCLQCGTGHTMDLLSNRGHAKKACPDKWHEKEPNENLPAMRQQHADLSDAGQPSTERPVRGRVSSPVSQHAAPNSVDGAEVLVANQITPESSLEPELEEQCSCGLPADPVETDRLEPEPICKHDNQSGHPAEPDIRMCHDCNMRSVDGGITWMTAAEYQKQCLGPELSSREPQWADCPRCRQKVLAPHECYESVLNEAGEREAASTIQESWVAFLLEHPTRGGLVERLIFDSGYRAGAASNLEINDNSGWEYDPDAALRRVRAECKAWISVDERLPEFSGTYIVAVNGPGDDGEAYIGTLPADWSITTKHWYDLRGWGHSEVTHWMPIPTAPGSLPSSDWKGRVDEL